MNPRRIISTTGLLAGAVLLSAGVQVLAYSGPSSSPPGGDAYAPLNTGPSSQSKQGPLTVNFGSGAPVGMVVGNAFKAFGDIKVIDGTDIGYGVISQKFCFGDSSVADITPTECISSWSEVGGGVDTSLFLDKSTTAQTKAGDLTVNGKFSSNGLVSRTDGKVVVGGGAPSGSSEVALTVNNRVRITGGSPGTGKVLTASGPGGDASWEQGIKFNSGVLSASLSNRTNSGSIFLREISLPSSYDNANYGVSVHLYGAQNDDNIGSCGDVSVQSRTTSKFVIATAAHCDGMQYLWSTVGTRG